MVEVHPEPDKALSDGPQSLTPAEVRAADGVGARDRAGRGPEALTCAKKGARAKSTSPAEAGVWSLRRASPASLTVLAMTFVAVRFVGGARDTLARTRDGACVALQPDPLPEVLRNGARPISSCPTPRGRMVSLSRQRGHPVLVNFWATWCPPCVEEVPSMEELARRLDGSDMRLLAVSVDDDWDTIRGSSSRARRWACCSTSRTTCRRGSAPRSFPRAS